jgi:hypothetical protein
VKYLVVSLLLCLAGAAGAAPPFGPYDYPIGGDGEIWYPSGDATFCEPDSPPGDSCLDTITSTDGTGAVTGTGVWHAHIPGQADGDVPFTITGQLAGTTRVPRPKLVAQFDGDITLHMGVMDQLMTVTGTGKFTCSNPLPHAVTFECPGHAKLCGTALGKRKCFGAGRVRIDVGAAGGPWTLSTNLMTDPNTGTITGTGGATLANTTSQDYVVTKGKYNARSDVSKMTLVPVDPASKNRVLFTYSFSGMYTVTTTRSVKFKVAGESGSYVIPPPAP